jgi:hypothetical protein
MDEKSTFKYLDEERRWFFDDWRDPSEFAGRVDLIESKICSAQYWGNPAKWLREAWVLARYVELTYASQVRLNEHDPPDAYVFLYGKARPIEVTFALPNGWKPGREYRSPGLVDKNYEKWSNKRSAVISSSLLGAINCKVTNALANPAYPPGTILIVDLNIGTYGNRELEAEAVIRTIVSRTYHPFDAVRVLWKGTLY